uniref:Transposase (Putative), gypsy type n=1 Tax=Tanacetum cinerariifolium TaxID=118510 RepID=A0A6L2JQL4_TANCI|nr:transposase (putative), gypsy type [Tanacetum cinerariifolium]
MSFSKRPRKNTPQCYTKPLDSLKNWNNRFFWVDKRVFPTIVDWRTSAPKEGMLADNTYSLEAVRILDTHRTLIQKQPEALLCLVGLSRRYYLGDEVYPTFLHDDDRDMDLFNLIRAPNPTKVKTGSHPRATHEVPLLTVTANRVIEIEDPAAATDSSGVPSTIERSPLDFANENPSQQSTRPEDQETVAPEVPPPENVTTMGGAPEAGPTKRVAATDPLAVKERRKRGHDGVDTNTPSKVLRRDHADPRPTESTRGGKSLAAIELGMGSTRPTPAPQGPPSDVSDPDPLSFADPQSRPSMDVSQSSKGAAAAGDPESENSSFASMVGSPKIQCKPGTTGGDGVAVAVEVRARSETVEEICCSSGSPGQKDPTKENEIKNLETLLEAEADIKKAAKDKSAKLSQELENMRALFSDLQVSNNRLSQQVSTLQEQRCAKMDAHLDALRIDFDEELYTHMLTSIAGRRKMIRHGLRLAVMKCGESIELRQAFADVVSAEIAKGMSEGLKHGVEHGHTKLDLEAIEAYDPEAKAKYIVALHALKNLKDDAPQWVRELRPSSSHLTIPVYPEVRDPTDPWAYKEEILLADTIAANVSREEKKKKCRMVCRTHGVGFAHHARSDGVLVSAPTVAPQGLAILLADAATQMETSDEASSQLLRSSSLPIIHG